jgi:hypothetical protein
VDIVHLVAHLWRERKSLLHVCGNRRIDGVFHRRIDGCAMPFQCEQGAGHVSHGAISDDFRFIATFGDHEDFNAPIARSQIGPQRWELRFKLAQQLSRACDRTDQGSERGAWGRMGCSRWCMRSASFESGGSCAACSVCSICVCSGSEMACRDVRRYLASFVVARRRERPLRVFLPRQVSRWQGLRRHVWRGGVPRGVGDV